MRRIALDIDRRSRRMANESTMGKAARQRPADRLVLPMQGREGDAQAHREGKRLAAQEDAMTTETARSRTEEFHLTGDELLAKVKELVHEGNIRRLIIRN